MAKPGRRPSTPSEYRGEFVARVKKAREDAKMDYVEMAAALTKAANRPVLADSYRKWESENLLPHDLIVPFCEVTGADPYELLTGSPFRLRLGRRNVA